MKYFFSLMIFCVPAAWCMAQRTGPDWLVQVSGGLAAPLGDFGKKDGMPDYTTSSSGNSGWAKAGPLVNLCVGHQFKNSLFGLALSGSWQQNARDNKALQEYEMKQSPGSDRVIVNAGKWKIWKVLAGPSVTLPVGHSGKWNFDCVLQAGILKTAIPSYSYVVYMNNNPSIAGNTSSQSMKAAFCYRLSPGLNYLAGQKKNISIGFALAYDAARPSIHYTYYSFPPSGGNGVAVHHDYQVSSLGLLLGVGFLF